MKTKKQLCITWLAAGTLALTFAACASEEANKDQTKPNAPTTAMGKPLRGFIDSTAYRASLAPAAKTRMTGFYGNISKGGTGIKFFFDKGEDYLDNSSISGYRAYLWVNTGDDTTPSWQVFGSSGTYTDGGQSIPMTQTVDKDADGNPTTVLFHNTSVHLTKESYKIRYGSNRYSYPQNGSIVISTNQYQATPGKGENLAESGDYATATAEDNGMYYDFVLNHHSAYMTFMPYAAAGDSHDALAQCKLWRIDISSDQAMSSTNFPVGDNGFNIQTWPTGGYNYINLYCQNYSNTSGPSASSTLNFNIASSETAARSNGAIMVLAPGTYTNVKIEYYVYDKVVNNVHVFTQKIPTLTLNPGKNRPVLYALKCKDYTNEFFNTYHQWGAKAVYWNTGIGGPYHNWNANGNNMDSGTPSYVVPQVGQLRYFSDVNGKDAGLVDAPSGSLDADAPTANLLEAYCRQPCYWDNEPFTYDGHLFSGRLWFMKKSFIAAIYGMSEEDLSTVYGSNKPTVTNYITHTGSYTSAADGRTAGNWSELPAVQKANYFFVLPLGGYYNGVLSGMTNTAANGMTYGAYWTSTGLNNSTSASWMLYIRFYYSQYKIYRADVSMISTYNYPANGTRTFGYPKWPGESLHN